MVSHHMLLWNRGEIKTCESVVLLQMTPSFSDGGQVGWVVILELLKDVPNELLPGALVPCGSALL